MSDIRTGRTGGNILTITIDRPERSNALDPRSARDIESALEQAEGDPEVRAVVVRSVGGRAFCGGYDLGEVGSGIRDLELQSMLARLRSMTMPTVAVVDGHAVGAGLDLACSCDLRVVRTGVRIGLPAVRLGVAYDPTGLDRIMAVAPGVRRLLLTGDQAVASSVAGFADVIVDSGEVESRLADLTKSLTSASPAAMAYMASMIRPGGGPRDREAAQAWRYSILDGPSPAIGIEAKRAGFVPEFPNRSMEAWA